jgi:hypothetical protein
LKNGFRLFNGYSYDMLLLFFFVLTDVVVEMIVDVVVTIVVVGVVVIVIVAIFVKSLIIV